MTNSRDLILKLKEVREEKGLSIADIMKMIEDNGDFISKSTIARVFAEGSEDVTFRYEATIKPIANALLDIGTIEDSDTMDVKAMKLLLKYKSDRIQELERQVQELESALDKQKIKASEKLEKERESFSRSIEFLKEQVAYKDKRMDLLLNAVEKKDKLHEDMLAKLLMCSACEKERR
jgi:transcriptional regulator with XRE-family HTH domain